jgi:hypothetical protein
MKQVKGGKNMKRPKRKPRVIGVVFNNLSVGTTRPVSFVGALERVCRKYAVRLGRRKRDYEFSWETTDG